MRKFFSSKNITLVLGVLVICFAVGFYIFAAWQEPGQEAPEGNVSAPINTGSLPQSKSGRISAAEFYDANDPNYYLNPSGDSKLSGNLNLGSATIMGNGSISTNLNADKLDDLDAADLLAQSGGETVFTRWGATTCPTGWTLLYSGKAYFLAKNAIQYENGQPVVAGVGVSGPICSSGISGLTGGFGPAEGYYASFFSTVCPDQYTCYAKWIDCAVCYK